MDLLYFALQFYLDLRLVAFLSHFLNLCKLGDVYYYQHLWNNTQ